MDPIQHVATFMDYGALGVLALSFLFVLWWLLKKLNDTVEQGYKEMQACLKLQASAQKGLLSAVIALQQQVMAHDLTVSGLNPAAGADFAERDSKAYQKYLQLQAAFENVQLSIKRMEFDANLIDS